MENRAECKIEVGQSVYIVDQLYNRKRVIKEGKVTKVGRKYVYVKFSYFESKFDIQNDYKEVRDYGTCSKLYFSIEEARNDYERKYLLGRICSFSRSIPIVEGISLDDLRTACNCLKIENNFEDEWETV